MANCPACGASVQEQDKFCTECGQDLHGEAPPPPPPPPAAPGADPTPKPASAEPTEPKAPAMIVAVPRWLAEDWVPAAVFAVGALVIGLVLQYLVGVVLLLIQWAIGDGIDWGATFKTPAVQFLALHGPIGGIGLWATGMAWLAAAFWLSGRAAAPEEAIGEEAPPRRWAAFVAKTAVVYAIPVGIAVAFVDPTAYPAPLPVDVVGAFGQPATAADWNLAETFTLGIVAALLLAAVVVARRVGTTPLGLVGLRIPTRSRLLSAAFAGARRTALWGLAMLAILVVVGVLFEALADDLEFRIWLAFGLTVLLSSVLWAGLDVATIVMVFSMRLFLGDDLVAAGGKPGWVYVGIGIVAVAFVAGGMRSAERYRATTPEQALLAGVLVGPLTGLVVFVLTWFAIGTVSEITGPGLLLPLLWSAAAATGGFLYANRQGLVSGVRFTVTDDGDDAE